MSWSSSKSALQTTENTLRQRLDTLQRAVANAGDIEEGASNTSISTQFDGIRALISAYERDLQELQSCTEAHTPFNSAFIQRCREALQHDFLQQCDRIQRRWDESSARSSLLLGASAADGHSSALDSLARERESLLQSHTGVDQVLA